jgi:hypothetical protein
MTISFFLGKFIGISLVVICFALLLHQRRFEKALHEITENPALWLLTSGTFFFLGLLIVFFHNLWVKDWRIVITLFGWLFLVCGTIRLCFQEMSVRVTKALIQKKIPHRLTWLGGIIGAILLYITIFASVH